MKKHITATFIALSSALPLQADENRPPYTSTPDCAKQSLNETFAPFAEGSDTDETGLDAFIVIGDAMYEVFVAIDPKTSHVDFITIQSQAIDSERDIWANARLDYEDGTQNGDLTGGGSGHSPTVDAVKYTRKMDDAMRRCTKEIPLGSLNAPSPFSNLG